MNSENAKHKLTSMLISGAFILGVAAVSVILFCRRDVLVYDDKYGYVGVLVLCFICNATVFAPAPSLIVVITAAQTLSPIPVVFLGAIGAALGEMVGYVSGKLGRNFVQKDGAVTAWIIRHGAIAVFLFALVPLPLFDLTGIASGYSKMKWQVFILACFLGKLLKMAIYVCGALLVKNHVSFLF